MISTLSQYQLVSNNIDRSLKIVGSDPTIERQSQYYQDNIRNIKSIDDFMSNDRIYSYAMKAMGLEEMTYAKAFVRKALEEGISNSDSFANRLNDKRYAEFVKVFNFAAFGEAATSFSSAQQGIVDSFMRQSLEEREGSQNEGVRLALYFERKASEITNAYEILADKALAQTVYTALNLPQSFGLSDIDKQAEYISDRIDFDQFKDPDYLKRFLEKFSALYDMQNGSPGASQVPSLIVGAAGGTGVIGLGEGLLSSIQNLKLGG
ncbi:uncharacterized protein DUF1217 [Roseibium hamelinense]|uniref:Uncharacterized protein DUF1217 n=1 Tax=Roseibium hamelinense TaxID=150831 RepID=A0A562TH74_9HYPH|nr:DUF1217 domain-containing protein [Roseibium hamelinense]MTI45893.1 DUF1217 domain-containing protein [Roseibium hamelinense]TWI92922.1 uncharacterized protein DUF1217 [Roseibium hamelinense]